MSVVTFWSKGNKETGQTMSMLAVATTLAMEHNFKILVINTNHEDYTMDEAFWKQDQNSFNYMLTQGKTDLTTGISGLTKALLSNKTSPEIITNYTKTIFKGRLEILTDKNIEIEEYNKQRKNMKSIIQLASKYYELVFVDLNGDIQDAAVQGILESSNLVVVNLPQSLAEIDKFIQTKQDEGLLRKKNVITLIGKSDENSKYNKKNVASYIKEKEAYSIPYDTQYLEATSEGGIIEFFMKYNNAKMMSAHFDFIESVKKLSNDIIAKLKELQMTSY